MSRSSISARLGLSDWALRHEINQPILTFTILLRWNELFSIWCMQNSRPMGRAGMEKDYCSSKARVQFSCYPSYASKCWPCIALHFEAD